MALERKEALARRHLRIRRKVSGTAERPRLCVSKSSRHLYVQLVDDASQRTLLALTTNRKTVKETSQKKSFRNREWAKKLGKEIAELAVQKGIRQVVFDRGGYLYHGCIKSLAEAARAAGLQF